MDLEWDSNNTQELFNNQPRGSVSSASSSNPYHQDVSSLSQFSDQSEQSQNSMASNKSSSISSISENSVLGGGGIWNGNSAPSSDEFAPPLTPSSIDFTTSSSEFYNIREKEGSNNNSPIPLPTESLFNLLGLQKSSTTYNRNHNNYGTRITRTQQ